MWIDLIWFFVSHITKRWFVTVIIVTKRHICLRRNDRSDETTGVTKRLFNSLYILYSTDRSGNRLILVRQGRKLDYFVARSGTDFYIFYQIEDGWKVRMSIFIWMPMKDISTKKYGYKNMSIEVRHSKLISIERVSELRWSRIEIRWSSSVDRAQI